MKIDLLQFGTYAPAHQAQLDAVFAAHNLDAVEADPALAGRIRGIVTRSNVRLPAVVLARLPQREIVATFGVGYDGLPLAAAATSTLPTVTRPCWSISRALRWSMRRP